MSGKHFSPLSRNRLLETWTWQIEACVVLTVLACTVVLSGGQSVEYIGAAAVFFTFMHAQVADRMAEAQAVMPEPSVECYQWSRRYFVIKEVIWLSYFVCLHAWSALAGVGVFLLYPVWRRYYRARSAEGVAA